MYGPIIHKLAPLLKQVATTIGRLCFVAYLVRERCFGNVAGMIRFLTSPITKS